MNKLNLCLALLSMCFLLACQQGAPVDTLPLVKGDYLGETPPDTIPKVFGDGFISTHLYTRDFAMMPDGKEMYYSITAIGYNLIYYTKQNPDQSWTEPQPASFIKDYSYMYYEPCISADGQKLYFLSDKPVAEGAEGNEDIWCVDRTGDTWGDPYNLGEPINTEGAEFYPSVTNDGTMYFTRRPVGERVHYIYRSKWVDGRYAEPEKLPEQVNCGASRFNAYIAPDESYIIVPAVGMEDTFGGTDYYICFRNADDTWTEPVNMGTHINTKSGREYSTTLSHDGKYLFFMTERKAQTTTEPMDMSLSKLQDMSNQTLNGSSNIFWVDAAFIKKLK